MNAPFAKDLRILVVEDSDLMRGLLKDMLSALDFAEAHTVPSAEDALTLLQKKRFNLVITDWLMDGMSGLVFLRKIRRTMDDPVRRTPVVMCTAYTDMERLLKARDAGVNEIVAKPFSPSRLHEAVANSISKPRPFIDCESYVGPDRRRRQIAIDFPDQRGRIEEVLL